MAYFTFQARNGRILVWDSSVGEFEKVTQCNFEQFQKAVSDSFVLAGRRKKALEKLQSLTAVPQEQKKV